MTLTDFVNMNVNDKVDYDKAYGSHCVDLFRQYVKDVLCYPHHTGVCATSGGAKDLYLDYEKMPKEKEVFTRVKTRAPKPGDVCVWDGTKTNQYGHVAICLGVSKDKIIVFEQDGYKQNGAKVMIRSSVNMLGVLRPKKEVL